MVNPEAATTLTEIINSVYSDQIDEVLDAQAQSDSTICLARDGQKLLAVKILDAPDSRGNQIYIRLVNPDEIDPKGESSGQQPASTSFAEAQPDTVDRFVSQLREKAQPEFAQMVATVRRALDDSTDLVQFREKIDQLYPNLQGEALTKLMAEAMFASRLAGVFESQNG